ncbi:hypothetical protein WR25_12975 isoform B [Diploscapter pachys]|uniref:IRG-type G domain-containing protein n=1 Tax=Diploscapter pachys TaxID=2018661 RepID=A0A2A2LK89_9BILA|nr:hypothetical protein WR25_12975 isoform B [Diploscapter pachys]
MGQKSSKRSLAGEDLPKVVITGATPLSSPNDPPAPFPPIAFDLRNSSVRSRSDSSSRSPTIQRAPPPTPMPSSAVNSSFPSRRNSGSRSPSPVAPRRHVSSRTPLLSPSYNPPPVPSQPPPIETGLNPFDEQPTTPSNRRRSELHSESTRKRFGEHILERLGRSPTPPQVDANDTRIPTIKAKKFLASVDESRSLGENPLYSLLTDFSFQSALSYNKGIYPVEQHKTNIAICGRKGSGKSALINALRGLNHSDPQAAGRNPCDSVEPFRFIEEELQQTVLWEMAYPRLLRVTDIYDRNQTFNRYYDDHKLSSFRCILILLPDGCPSDDDIVFARVAKARRNEVKFLLTKTDEELDAECRESGRRLDENVKKEFEARARGILEKRITTRGKILIDLDAWFISSHVIKSLLTGKTNYIHYRMDETKLLRLLDLRENCHAELDMMLKEQRALRSRRTSLDSTSKYQQVIAQFQGESPTLRMRKNDKIEKCTVLADAGFEILYGTDDRVFANFEPKTTVIRTGKTTFNYGFIGKKKVGKSSLINAMRGMAPKHPLAAGKSNTKKNPIERFDFEDELLHYNVKLWEMHYPSHVNHFFEFIDRHDISSFTALFIVLDSSKPSSEDLAFAKIAFRRNTSV